VMSTQLTPTHFVARSNENIDAARPIKWLYEVREQSPDDFGIGFSKLLPWSSLDGIHKAAERIACAITRHERIVIVGDYDADGATATAVLLWGFRALGADAHSVVPSRFKDGYGLSPRVAEHAKTLGASLIVTVDNGVSAFLGIGHAVALGIEVVVTDHHLAGESLPECTALVNPNQISCPFESKALAGCGVAFYVLAAVRTLLTESGNALAKAFDVREVAPFVALGTVADMVRMDRNNQALVSYGVRRIRAGECALGITALAETAGIDVRNLTTSDIAFKIAPRINAAGRIADMSMGIACLTSQSKVEAEHAAVALHATNTERRTIQDSDLVDIEGAVEVQQNKAAIVVESSTAHEGVIGIIAGRLRERFHRPSVVFKVLEDGSAKGSARSVPGFHLRDCLAEIASEQSGLFIAYGGHAGAAGMTLSADSIETFRQMFCRCVERATAIHPEITQPIVTHDGPLPASLIDVEFAKALEQAPWGVGLPEPVFVNEFLVLDARTLKEKHQKVRLKSLDGGVIDAIWFFAPTVFSVGDSATLAFKIGVNRWRGFSTLQAQIIGDASMKPQSVQTENLNAY
jgi:single-stranded-DNA-specific exonuclease